MSRPGLSSCCAALALGLALLASESRAEARFAAAGQGASAGLDFRIVIPPVMRLLENSHPERLVADLQGRLAGTQTLVVLSNLKRGFCLMLKRPQSDGAAATAWNLKAVQADGLSADFTGDGWRLCAAGPGRYTWRLQHEFDPAGEAGPRAMSWPVWAELAAL